MSAKDFSNAISLLLKKNKTGVFNIGNDKHYKNLEIAETICEKFKKDKKKYINFVKDRPFNDRRYSVGINKIRKIGWKPQDSLLSDLNDIIRWYKKNINLFKI